MSKITFRADDDLVEAVERLDESKSEVMRDALRAYLGDRQENSQDTIGRVRAEKSIEEIVTRRVDEILSNRPSDSPSKGGDEVTVRLRIEGDAVAPSGSIAPSRDDQSTDQSRHYLPNDPGTPSASPSTCPQCGSSLDADHVYCPNCGEQAGQSYYCECGTQLRPGWSFCPDCGRRTSSADVLDH
ncbi:MAG: zinc ribbon domain-containing protein [Halanaeroarchaeum sp.]